MDEAQALAKMVPPSKPRKNAWRGGIIQIWVTRSCDKACFGCTQGSNLAGKSTDITPEQFEEAVLSLKGFWGVYGVFGGNPCHAGGTPVYTTAGIFPIEDLEGKVFHVRNLRGETQPATCWLAGRGRQLYEVKLRGGHSYFATADHEWPALELMYGSNPKQKNRPGYYPRKTAVSLGKVRTVDLKPGMRLPISSADALEFGSDGDAEDGFLAGWVLGDGWILPVNLAGSGKLHTRGKRSGKPVQTNNNRGLGLIVSEVDNASGITTKLAQKLASIGSSATFRAVKKCYEINIRHASVDDWMEKFGLLGKQSGLPAATWSTGSEEFRKGLIDGLFSADGSVEVSRQRGFVRVRLTSAHEKLVRDVSVLLGFYGIKTQIDSRTRTGSFPNRKSYNRTYTSFTLSISNAASVERFAKLFPLTHTEKNTRLQAAVGKHKTGDVESTNIEIVSVTPTNRYEDVWDISVADDTHTFQLPHCVTGNCVAKHFEAYCEILRKHVPQEQCGLWCNKLFGKGKIAAKTFNPKVSNLNVHLDQAAFDEFKRDWPGSRPFGLKEDSRHAPVYVAMQDVVDADGNHIPEAEQWDKIANCDINQNWSSMICVFRNQLRGFFCEIAGAQAMLHQHEPDYPDTGVAVVPGWWQRPMTDFAAQVRLHCKACGVPLRGYGSLAQDESGIEQVSATHASIYNPKRVGREVQLVQLRSEVSEEALTRVTDYVQNSKVKKS